MDSDDGLSPCAISPNHDSRSADADPYFSQTPNLNTPSKSLLSPSDSAGTTTMANSYRSVVANQIAIERYFKDALPAENDEDWLLLPEVPDAKEVAQSPDDQDSEVCENRIDCNWTTKAEYLSAQYGFLREESSFALRRAVNLLRSFPFAAETDLKDESPGIGIYDKAYVTGITLSTFGLGVRMCFSTFRTGVKIDWTTSKRLKSGSLIAISLSKDRFTTFVVGIVAARPLFLLNGVIPAIDVFFPRPEETLFDPAVEYVILEETSSFFEAQRHNMLAIQRMTKESTPLQQYTLTPLQQEDVSEDDLIDLTDETNDLIDLTDETDDLIDLTNKTDTMTLKEPTKPEPAGVHSVGIPDYVRRDPIMDLSPITGNEDDCYSNALEHFPTSASDSLDQSQMDALCQILTREVALIQGPPGTGKTHVSKEALRIMLKNMEEQRRNASLDHSVPPIIVACQTNHALDQLLRHVARFEPEFVRLGGQSADQDVVLERTLYELQQGGRRGPIPKAFKDAFTKMKLLEKGIRAVLAPLEGEKEEPKPMDEESFRHVLTSKQIDSLRNSKWQISDDSVLANAPAIVKWLGRDAPFSDSPSKWPHNQEFGFETFEEEEEIIDEATAEQGKRNDDIETLRGIYIPLADYSILNIPKKADDLKDAQILKLLNKFSNLDNNKIQLPYRRQVYAFLVRSAKTKILERAKNLAIEWASGVVDKHRVGKFSSKLEYLQSTKVVGLTVTGLAKYRPMIHTLKPRIILIEEAGECLEANMATAFLPSLQHLILVGDHRQLRPRAQKTAHNRLHYDISLFERLASNTVDFRMLTVQRRMHPEIRRLLWPIYGNCITDHKSVHDRSDVPGMGNCKTHFFTHDFPEDQDKFKSCYNEMEASRVVDMVNNLIRDGTEPSKITILTFYNGQRRLINRKLRDRENIENKRPKVYTVDSYQGEENDVIVLSLVRSNFSGSVGFVSVANRICVALSRARRGLYIYGNAELLEQHGGPEWEQVLAILKNVGPEETKIKYGRVSSCD